jgi:prevent-host-death family protein
MKVTLVELRRNPARILEAIERNETVTLSKRGREIARIVPIENRDQRQSIRDEPAVGMWADRDEMADPSQYVRAIRKARYRDL